jgi:chromosome segregation ATPase
VLTSFPPAYQICKKLEGLALKNETSAPPTNQSEIHSDTVNTTHAYQTSPNKQQRVGAKRRRRTTDLDAVIEIAREAGTRADVELKLAQLNEAVALRDDEIGKLKEELSRLAEGEQKRSELEKKIESQKARIESLQLSQVAQVNAGKEDAQHLLSIIEEQAAELVQHKEICPTVVTQARLYEETIRELRATIAQKEVDVIERNTTIQKLESDTKRQQVEITKHNTLAQQQQQGLSKKDELVAKLEAKVERAERIAEKTLVMGSSALQLKDEAMKSLQEETQQIAKEREQLRAALDARTEAIRQLEYEVDEKHASMVKAEADTAREKRKTEFKYNDLLRKKGVTIKELRAAAERYLATIASQESQLQQLTAMGTEQDSKSTPMAGQNGEFNEKFCDLQIHLHPEDVEISNRNQTSEQQKATIDEQAVTIHDQTISLRDQKSTGNEQAAQLTAHHLQSSAPGQAGQIKSRKAEKGEANIQRAKQVETHDGQELQHAETIQQLLARITELEGYVEQRNSTVFKLQKIIDGQAVQIKLQSTPQLQKKDARIEQLQDKVEYLRSLARKLSGIVKEKNSLISQLRSQIDDMQEDTAIAGKLKVRCTELAATNAALQAKVSNLEPLVKITKKQDVEIGKWLSKAQELEMELSKLRAKTESNTLGPSPEQPAIASLKTKVAEQEKELTRKKHLLEEKLQHQHKLEQELEEAEKALVKLKKRYAQLQDEIEELQANADAEHEHLHQQIDYHKERYHELTEQANGLAARLVKADRYGQELRIANTGLEVELHAAKESMREMVTKHRFELKTLEYQISRMRDHEAQLNKRISARAAQVIALQNALDQQEKLWEGAKVVVDAGGAQLCTPEERIRFLANFAAKLGGELVCLRCAETGLGGTCSHLRSGAAGSSEAPEAALSPQEQPAVETASVARNQEEQPPQRGLKRSSSFFSLSEYLKKRISGDEA